MTVGQIKVERSFEAKPLAEGLRPTGSGGMKFGDASSAGDRGSDSNRFDCRAATSFRHLKENGAVDKIHLPRAFFVTENSVRAEAGYG